MMQSLLETLTVHCRNGSNLDTDQCKIAVEALLDAGVPDDEKAAFLTALATKGETAEELARFVEILLPHAVDPGIHGQWEGRCLLDCCGTGGGGLNLINVSTALMFILAACGVPVVKHGNRGVTKKSGSADVLEALGGELTSPDQVLDKVRGNGMAFCFAPAFHPAFKEIAPVRKQLAAEGQRTIFNLLGPLLNPCRPSAQMMGVFSEDTLPLFSKALRLLGRERYLVVYGEDARGHPMGEVSSLGRTHLMGRLGDESINLEFQRESDASLDDFLVMSGAESGRRLEEVFRKPEPGPLRDLLVLNAGVGLWVGAQSDSIESGEIRALQALESGAVLAKLEAWRKQSNE